MFTSASLNKFERTLKGYCESFISGIRRVAERDGYVDFKDWFHRLSFDVSQISLFPDFRLPEGSQFLGISAL
jgi:hypothetical protein